MSKYNVIDLFSGCGGLLDGFLQSDLCYPVASVEWEKAPVDTLRKRLKNKWRIDDADSSVIYFDMQRTDELLEGFDDEKYGDSEGLLSLIGEKQVDFIIGGPPCQAYSVASRVSIDQTEKIDYRNFLFEYYMKVVYKIQPKVFVFENVPGMLSAMPDGTPIFDLIKRDIKSINFEIIDDARKYAILDASEFSVPQKRKRVILLGLNRNFFKQDDIQETLRDFYINIIPKYKGNKIISVGEAIGDLPPCYPLWRSERPSHSTPRCDITWQVPRFNSVRDVKIFEMLAKDIENGDNKYVNSEELKKLYNEATGSNTNVHKYHVLRKNEPSTTILAHLYKDGLRFIHYDSMQARPITVREAARLQTFDDDFDFVGNQSDAFKMIGNAVPPQFAKRIALALDEFVRKYL